MRSNILKKNGKVYIFKHQQEESGGGSTANLEDNKNATIDVSSYTEPVEIEPTEGKDGMAKATVSLTNIPSVQSLYIWNLEEGSDSVILPVGTFEEITVGMKGIGCSSGSEFMFEGTVFQKENDLVSFKDANDNYHVYISDNTTVTPFPNLT